MAILAHKCPHAGCLTENISLQVVAVTRLKSDWAAILHLECPRCLLPSAAHVEHAKKQGIDAANIQQHPGEVTSWGYELQKFWPEPPAPEVPDLMPPDVSRVYLQAERNFMIAGNEEAAGMMYRKALDIGLKKIDPNLRGMLGPRIKKLAEQGKLTTDIAEWSDIIREDGNDAAHEEQPISREDLIGLRSLTEMVLRYLFSLPNAVRKRRGEKLAWEDSDGAA